MWRLILRSGHSDSRAHKINTPPNHISLSKDEASIVNPKLFPEGTCTACKKITLHGLLRTYYGSVEKCWLECDGFVPTDCPMCNIILDSFHAKFRGNKTEGIRLGLSVNSYQPVIDIYTGRQIHEISVWKFPDYDWSLPGYSNRSFRIYAEPGSYTSNFVPRWRAPSSNLSDDTFQKISRWLKDCDKTHTACRSHFTRSSEAEARHLPTRVIHVGSATRPPHLHVSKTHQSDYYMALSHCWGTLPQVRTLKANIKQHRKGIVFEGLSKTFQDAIGVARRLGIRYIWIDSLCIVQDDEDDWLRESEKMGSVYAGAYITIAATSARDGSGGLDGVRPMSNWVRFPCEETDKGKGYMWFTDAPWNPTTDLDNAPLNSRGWVFQEKVLSRRIIHFTSSQVYWECKQRFSGEECEDESGVAGGALKPSDFWAEVKAVRHIGTMPIEPENWFEDTRCQRLQLDGLFKRWRELVEYFSTREFTRKSDRLIALLGIIRVVEKQTGLRCVDGHWNDGSLRFIYELLWLRKGENPKPLTCDNTRPRLCSSWSWASLEGPIQYDIDMDTAWESHGPKNCLLHLEAIEDYISVPLRWSSHPLKVLGTLGIFYKGGFRGDANWIEDQGRRSFDVQGEIFMGAGGSVCFDREEEEPEQFHFAPVYFSDLCTSYLALVEIHRPESNERWFKRVGAGHIKMLRRENYTWNRIRSFETCERSVFYIV